MKVERSSRRSRLAFWCLPLASLLAAGCQRPSAAPGPMHPVIYATPTVVTPHDESPAERFERARLLLLDGRAAEAVPLFDELAAAEGPDDLASFAAFNAGIGWDQLGERRISLERFRTVLERHPQGDLGKWAALRAARLLADLEEWSPLSAMADLLLARADLVDVERIESYGSKALSVVEAGDPEAAERYIAKGRDIVDALRLGEGGTLPLEVALLYYALGEVRRVRSEAIVFVPVPAHFAEVLEQRCQGLLDAQNAYSEAMRSYDARWAEMSGYRVGQLYQRLYKDVLAIPVPRSAVTAEKKRLFEGAMRLRYRVLLEKGLTMMEHTILIGVRTGHASGWIERAKEAKRELDDSLREQREFIAKLPYTERELQAALEDLRKP